ncbi:ECF-type sigma factor [Acanthopleuribacter pedis]|uniref:RNA polymerase sigma-70 ECF-like HTH domain-containing protein n=1 Tax=Acanthopleuribacter pedis TaxID=442870 RepID=A0A8J7QC65_9BACT|nr:hypothetical protein [Acanthopleuribacter pedis]
MDITQELARWQLHKDREALNLVIEFAFEELQLRARGLLRENRLVDTGELVNAAYIKLTKMEDCQFQNRGQFYNLVATIMRNFLVDEVRRRGSQKRDAESTVTFDEMMEGYAPPQTVRHLQSALQDLHELDPQAFEVAIDRITGSTFQEIATRIQVSVTQTHRKWSYAHHFLAERVVVE